MSADVRDIAHPPHLQGAKEAFKALVRAYGGQEAAVEGGCGKSQSRLCDYGRPNTPDFAPIDVVDFLEARTHGAPGWPHVTDWLCRRRGGVFLPLPDGEAPPGQWTGFVAALAEQAGGLTSGICTDLADDHDVTPAEARRRLGDAAELVRVAVSIEAALKARAEEA